MVSHAEEDLLCIRAAYLKLTGTSLYTALQVGPTQCAKHALKYLHKCLDYFIIFFKCPNEMFLISLIGEKSIILFYM